MRAVAELNGAVAFVSRACLYLQLGVKLMRSRHPEHYCHTLYRENNSAGPTRFVFGCIYSTFADFSACLASPFPELPKLQYFCLPLTLSIWKSGKIEVLRVHFTCGDGPVPLSMLTRLETFFVGFEYDRYRPEQVGKPVPASANTRPPPRSEFVVAHRRWKI